MAAIWTSEMIAELRRQCADYRAQGKRPNYRAIAAVLGVTYDAVAARMQILNTNKDTSKPRAATRPRPCLCCGNPFQSEGAHHRLCGGCRIAANGYGSLATWETGRGGAVGLSRRRGASR